MGKKIIIALFSSIFFLVFSTYAVNATTININSVTDDSFVNQNSPTTNYGTDSTLIVESRQTSGSEYTFIKFDLSSIPSGATITSATLNLYATSAATSSTYEARQVSSTWSESTIIWDTMPGVSGSAVTTTASLGWMSWDVTSDVQAFYSGSATNYGWRIKDSLDNSEGSGYLSTFYSSEATVIETPYLSVTYTEPATCDISVSPALAFGSMNPIDTSSDQSTTVTNNGNTATTSLTISGNDWSDGGSNSFDVDQTHWYLSDVDYESMTPLKLLASADTVSNLGSGASQTYHFKLQIPSHQVVASYTQTITFTWGC